MNYLRQLQEMREKYEAKPYKTRKFKVPFWLQETDKLYALYQEYEQLFANGKVYYGYVLQANRILFKAFPPIDYPALVFYCTDPVLEADPEEVGNFAFKIYEYKSKPIEEVPEEYREAANILNDDMARKDLVLPHTLPDGTLVHIHMKTIMVTKKFLPKRKISTISSIMPILALPDKLTCEVVLPHIYWTKDIKKYW